LQLIVRDGESSSPDVATGTEGTTPRQV
jgi:hypothetical protein